MGTGELLEKPNKYRGSDLGVEILLATSCYRKWDKPRQLFQLVSSKASHTSLGGVLKYLVALKG